MTKPVAIVTGASRGVGKAVALLLAEKGWNLTLTCSSSLKEAKKVAKECNDLGAETIVLTADVSDVSKCKETVQKTIEEWKRLDVLINNAGKTVFNAHENLAGLKSEDFLEIYKTNTVGPYMMIKEAEEFLRKSPIASVVNIASIAGENDIGGLKEWTTDMPIDAEFVLDEDAQRLADEAAKSSTCIPIGEGENCW